MNQPADNPLFRFAPWTVAAVMAVAALWVTRQNVSLQQENATFRTERSLAEVARHLAKNQLTERTLLAEGMINSLGRQLRRAEDFTHLQAFALRPAAGPRGETQVMVVWDAERQAGLLVFDQLPAPGGSQDYQLWVTEAGTASHINGGVVPITGPGPGVLVFKPDRPVAQADGFALSLEQKGGAPRPGGTFVLLSK